MEHKVPHDLGREKAKQVAEKAFSAYQEKYAKYGPKASWVDEHRCQISFTVKGTTLNGSMQVNERDIALDLDVPFLFRPFKGTAIGVIEKEIQAWLAKAKRGEI